MKVEEFIKNHKLSTSVDNSETFSSSKVNDFIKNHKLSTSLGSEQAPEKASQDTVTEWFGSNPLTLNYWQEAFNQAKDTVQHPITAVTNAVKAAGNTVIGAFSNVMKQPGNLISNYTDPNKSAVDKITDFANALSADAGAVFSPISSVFAAAEKLPILKEAADIFNGVFTATGKVASLPVKPFVNALPLSQQDKDKLIPAFEGVTSLAGQIILGGKVMDLVMKGVGLKETDVNKMSEEAQSQAETVRSQGAENLLNQGKITPEQYIEITGGWKPGMRTQFDTALMNGDAATVKNLLPDVPTDYKLKFADTIKQKTGIDVNAPQVNMVPIVDLVSHEGAPDVKTVERYKKDIQAGKEIEPIKVARDSQGKLGIEDGKHKYQAYVELGYKDVPTVDVTSEVNARSQKAKTIPPELKALADEAKKHKSAEEFINTVTDAQKVQNTSPEVKKTIETLNTNTPEKVISQLTDVWKKANSEVKTSGLAKRVEQAAIEENLTKGFKDLATYEGFNFKEQAKLLSDIPTEDLRKIVRGEEKLPSHLREGTLLSELERRAKQADVQTKGEIAGEIASSKLTGKASEFGSGLSAFQNINKDSFLAKMQEIRKAIEERAGNQSKATEKKANAVREKLAKSTKVEGIDVQKLTDFIKENLC